MSVIAAHGLSRRYGSRVGVDRIDLKVEAGEIFGFLGPNGAGKSTAIRVLLGFLQPTSGQAFILGKDCWSQSPSIKRDVGYLPGDVRLYPWLTARRAIKILSLAHGIDLSDAGTKLANRFDLEIDLPVRKMSKGTRQKLGLVMTMAHRPQVLILDEPTSGLDPLVQDQLAALLRELAAEGRTVFFSSHTLSEVESLCDRVAIVRRGQIVADERLESLRRRAKRRVEVAFADRETADRTALPEFLHLVRREGPCWICELAGEAGPLVRWAAGQSIVDLSVGRPELDSLFFKYYDADGESD